MSKVIIVDDHILFRLGIRAAIEESFADISIIAECSSAHELLIHLKNGTKPDLILLDIIIPEIDGIEIAKIILRDYPDIKILVLTTDTSTEICFGACRPRGKRLYEQNSRKDRPRRRHKIGTRR